MNAPKLSVIERFCLSAWYWPARGHKMKTRHQGYIVWEDKDRVAIASGFRLPSTNDKTGPMIQVWMLVKRLNPIAAIHSGLDRLVCGKCPLRGKKGKKRICYVNQRRGPAVVWKAYNRGLYPKLPGYEVFKGRQARLTAYGGPEYLPGAVVAGITQAAIRSTGYTHAWRDPRFQWMRQNFMASVESEADATLAQNMGWRTYRILGVGQVPTSGEIMCPYVTRGVQCVQCGLCAGQSVKAKSIACPATGLGKGYFKS